MHDVDPVPVRLAVCGVPVVGQTLARLLRGSRYDVRFVPSPSLADPGSLEGSQLLLLTPLSQLDARHREALLVFLEGKGGASDVPVLELTTSQEEESCDGEARDGSWRTVPWPCSMGELERHIEAALPPVSEENPSVRKET